ncbi:MAG: serine/threonine protein kinase [Deltaproteobacteria bacterium]|nr:serine/threonine protein kinase [Deltaproteobacteria bacterium]
MDSAEAEADIGELVVGQKIGPYRLLFRLGKGGMGEVWAAQATGGHGFAKLVALKLLTGAEADSNSATMFFDEAKAAAALSHPAIVNTTDLGQYQQYFYLAMDMVTGPSLTALLQKLAIAKKPMEPGMVIHVGNKIASALDYAYNRAQVEGKLLRLVHRDISPHNVLIDLAGNVRLTDFGVARTAVQDHKSRAGTVRGKPSYMAPEQVVGGDIDGRTDIFALGIVLYECASVKRLFGRSNPVKSMDAVINYTPKPLTEIVPGFPEDLWLVIKKSLEKDPKDRYESAGEFAKALLDAARSIRSFAAVESEVGKLIRDSFEPGAFAVEARVREAEAQIQLMLGDDVPLEPTNIGQLGGGGIEVRGFADGQGTAAWPSAYAADPLAPEVLDAISQQQPQILTNPSISDPALMFQTGSQSFSMSGAAVVEPKRSNALMWGAIAVAVLAIGGVGLVLANKPGPPTQAAEIQPEQPSGFGVVSGQPRPEPGATASPGATTGPGATAATPPPVEPAPAPAKARPRPASAAAQPPPSEPAPETPKPPSSSIPPAPDDATELKKATWPLIQRVSALDSTEGSRLKAAYSEAAGGGNEEALRKIYNQAKAVLEK